MEAAIEEAVPVDVITSALFARFRSRQEHAFGEKMSLPCALVSADTSRARRRVPRRHSKPQSSSMLISSEPDAAAAERTGDCGAASASGQTS